MELASLLFVGIHILVWCTLAVAFVYVLVQQIRRMRREQFNRRDN